MRWVPRARENNAPLAARAGVCERDAARPNQDARLRQLEDLRSWLSELLARDDDADAPPLLLLGDFNALRARDYQPAARWRGVRDRRAKVGIRSDERVTRALEERWGLRDCRALAAAAAEGGVATSVHGVRVDYVWASARALERYAVERVAHVALEPRLQTTRLLCATCRGARAAARIELTSARRETATRGVHNTPPPPPARA